MRALLVTAIAAVVLVGCFHADGSRLMCPPIVAYSDEVQRQAAAELTAAEKAGVPQPNVNRLVDDYHKLREAAKACR
jgi:hypothetical protein